MGKEIGNGFPVTAMAVCEEHADAPRPHFQPRRWGESDGCAAVDAVIDVMREQLVDHAADLGEFAPAIDAQRASRSLQCVHGRGLRSRSTSHRSRAHR
jgi:4-aminobutyrate aminotransferase-like enzyme